MEAQFDVITFMKDGFKSFPQLKSNDYTVEQMDFLQAAQDNLNANMENINLAQKLVQATNEVAQKLSTQYGDNWANPFKK